MLNIEKYPKSTPFLLKGNESLMFIKINYKDFKLED